MSAASPLEAAIGTPDRRVRVFVSSTLEELADERRAVSRAISTLRLTAVLFEAGARPHPPRELYRAYLEQSDVFVGLYWQRYGWVGPGMEVSGLEEELRLSTALPRLLYLKEPAPDRDPRLAALLDSVAGEASYRHFRTSAELARLVRDDLAVLLSDRFAATRTQARRAPRPGRTLRWPAVPATPLVGRDREVAEAAALVARPDVPLLTITGPSGVGKTRLALAVAERIADRFAGTAVVQLAAVTRSELVLAEIGRAVGAELAAADHPVDAVAERLEGERWLVVLDNLEELVGAAGDLNELLARCRGLTVVATSLIPLRLRVEREYPLAPLRAPAQDATSIEELAAAPAVGLFIDRARAVRPNFALTAANAAAIAEICRRLEGLPLAIELAAARLRLLDPNALLERLSRSLDALGTGTVDLPERQRTLRATVEWSVGLLDDAERSLLDIMAVFAGGWTVEVAGEVAGLDEDRALDLTETLTRHSLIQPDLTEHGSRSRMLDTIRRFVRERLEARPDAAEVHRRHAECFGALATRADRPLRRLSPSPWAGRLELDADNLAAAVRWYLAHDRAPLPHLFRVLAPFRVLWPFWGLRDEVMTEARSWVEQLLPDAEALDAQPRAELLWTAMVTALEVGDLAAALAARVDLEPLIGYLDDPYLHAVSQLVVSWTAAASGDVETGARAATRSIDELRKQDEPLWTALALITAGSMETALGGLQDAARHLGRAVELGDDFDAVWLSADARVHLGVLRCTEGRADDALAMLRDSLELSLESGSTHILAMSLAAFARQALAAGDAERAAMLAGAVSGLRRRASLRAWDVLRGDGALAEEIRVALGPERFKAAFGAGERLDVDAAVAEARRS